MSRAITELRSIARMHAGYHGDLEREIEEWLKRNIVELAVETTSDVGIDEKHRQYLSDQAMRKLGNEVAKHFNPYPKYLMSDSTPYLKCKLAVLVFKNDLGKGIAPGEDRKNESQGISEDTPENWQHG